MTGEQVQFFDQDGTVRGICTRQEAEEKNLITENVLIFIFNSLGKVWIHRRPGSKALHPGKWDVSACGGVILGETHRRAAERELEEETGLKNIKLHYIETYLNKFMTEDARQTKRLSNLYIGVSDQMPKINADATDFKSCRPRSLLTHCEQNSALYVPSFSAELSKAIVAHAQLA